MKESRIKEQKAWNKNSGEQQWETGMESRQQKETIGKVIFDYIKKEIDKIK